MLADDTGRRAVPLWIVGAGDLANLLERAGEQVGRGPTPQNLSVRLLDAARARVTGVDIEVTDADATVLSPDVSVARVTVTGPAGSRQVTADLGLALAAAAPAPVRLGDGVLERLAVPVPGDDLLTPFLDRVPPIARAQPDGLEAGPA